MFKDEQPRAPPGQYLCFGDIHAHTATFVISLFLNVLFNGYFIPKIVSTGCGLIGFGVFIGISVSLFLVLYGNCVNNPIFYWPAIYILRPSIVFVIPFGVSVFQEAIEVLGDPYKTDSYHVKQYSSQGLQVIRAISILTVLLYAFNIFALDYVYVKEKANHPIIQGLPVRIDNLKNRLIWS